MTGTRKWMNKLIGFYSTGEVIAKIQNHPDPVTKLGISINIFIMNNKGFNYIQYNIYFNYHHGV